jgi:hypothetical protein
VLRGGSTRTRTQSLFGYDVTKTRDSMTAMLLFQVPQNMLPQLVSNIFKIYCGAAKTKGQLCLTTHATQEHASKVIYTCCTGNATRLLQVQAHDL